MEIDCLRNFHDAPPVVGVLEQHALINGVYTMTNSTAGRLLLLRKHLKPEKPSPVLYWQ